MNVDSGSRGGGTVSTVESAERGEALVKECTTVRCVLQLVGVTADVLSSHSELMSTYSRYVDVRSKYDRQFVAVERRKTMRVHVPVLY